jgi:endonuclease I
MLRRAALSDKNRPLFEAWNSEDPVDARECERDRRIAALQGNHNPFAAAERAVPDRIVVGMIQCKADPVRA